MPGIDERTTVTVFGSVSISVGHQNIDLTPVERHIVALLVASGPSGLDIDRLADQLWPDELPNSWRASFRNNVSRLNRKVSDAHPKEARLISERSPERRLLVDKDDVDLWRLQAWAAVPNGPDVRSVEVEPALLAGSPFSNCEMSGLLLDCEQKVAACRRDIIGSWATQEEQLPHRLLADLRQLALRDPYDDPLVEAVVELHLARNEYQLTIDLLDALSAEVPLSPTLTAVSDDLRQNRHSPSTISANRRATAISRSPTINQLAAWPIAGRSVVIDELISVNERKGPGVLIHGEGGIGKTRVAAEVATRLGATGFHTAYIVADRRGFGSLQPFLDGFPGLQSRLQQHLPKLNNAHVQAACRQEVLDYLSAVYAGHPLCLVMDDLQWFDDQSAALAISLARAGLPDGLFIVAVGRSIPSDQRWSSWLNDLSRTNLHPLKIRPLVASEVMEMIRTVYGDLEEVGARNLATQLLDLSSGIPGVTRWLLDRVDVQTMSVKTDEVDGTGYAAMVNDLPSDLLTCGAAASILGRHFQIDDVASLLSLDTTATDDLEHQLQQIAQSGLIIERAVPGTYEFAHVLATDAFEQTLGLAERVRLHAMAFELFDDPLRRAHHATAAAPTIGDERAADALVEAARQHFTEGHFTAVVAELTGAAGINPDSLTSQDRILIIEAIERSGVRAGAQREELVTEALGRGEQSLAYRAATTGLPDTEALEGDHARVRVLQRIDPMQLPNAERVDLHLQLCRQLLFVGRIDEAHDQAALAERAATTADERAQAWLAKRLLAGSGRPLAAGESWPAIDEIVSPELRLQIGRARTVDLIAGGGSRSDWESIARHAEEAAAGGIPQLEWFSNLFVATALADQGRLAEAREVSARARQLGLRAGLRLAEGTYLTHLFVWALIDGRHGRMYPDMAERGPADVTGNLFFDAAQAASHVAWATSDTERARAHDRVRTACGKALHSTLDLGAVGIMADAIADTGDEQLMEWASNRLTAGSGNYVLVAAAAANLGPASRLLAKLEPDRQAAIKLFRQAITDADRDELALWQVVGRLDLVDLLDPADPESAELQREISALTSTGWLRELVAKRRDGQSAGDG
jgi:DNA-binding SARP family transcriptional activator